MRAAALGIVGCALLVAAFAAFAPATLVDRRVAAATGGKLRVVDAEGTVWTGRGALAVELVTPAISSPGLPESFAPTIAERLAENRHLKWVEVSRRGFIVLDVDRARVHGTFHHLDDAHLILPDATDLTVAAEVEVRRGTPRLIKL